MFKPKIICIYKYYICIYGDMDARKNRWFKLDFAVSILILDALMMIVLLVYTVKCIIIEKILSAGKSCL